MATLIIPNKSYEKPDGKDSDLNQHSIKVHIHNFAIVELSLLQEQKIFSKVTVSQPRPQDIRTMFFHHAYGRSKEINA